MDEKIMIGEEIQRLWNILVTLEPGSKEYNGVLANLRNIMGFDKELGAIAPEQESKLDKILGNTALLGVVGNLALGLLILNHERTNVITSRAFNLLRSK